MIEDAVEVRKIRWSDALPFARLLRTGTRAIAFWPMVLALVAVVSIYVVGRVLDALWTAGGGGVVVALGSSELHAYALGGDAFDRWIERAAAVDAPRAGPFAALLDYELDALGAAVRGVSEGRFSFAGGAFSPEPALLGSLASAVKGPLWLVTRRFWYAVLFGALSLGILAFFGTAICRVAAVSITQRENLPVGDALSFAREKWLDALAAPLWMVLLFAVVAVFMILGSLVGAIPVVGEVLAGLFYGLALLGGLALLFATLVFAFGTHLMWPTLAVEGSDHFDAVQHGAGYVLQRPWSFAFYALVLLITGALWVLLLRVLLMLLLKLTHMVTGVGIDFFGAAQSSATGPDGVAIGKLDGMWTMPGWADLPLLPAVGEANFWGELMPWEGLSGSETVGAWLLSVWVFVVVGLLAAYALSYYLCGATEMYLLLRREIDKVDYDEIFWEGLPDSDESPADGQPGADESSSTSGGGTSLPVVGNSGQ